MDWRGGGGGCRSSWAVARLLRLDLGSALSGTIAVDACARNQMKSIACGSLVPYGRTHVEENIDI